MAHTTLVRPFHARLGMSMVGIVLLIAIIGVFALAYTMRDQAGQKADRKLSQEMQDPETLLNRLFIELEKKHEFKEKTWENLLGLMSEDDRLWFEQNFAMIASMNPKTEGMVAMAITEREKRYSALEYLTRFGQQTERPIIVRVQTSDNQDKAVAFVHPPNRANLMREIFLVRETSGWKVRRFMGDRDAMHIMTELTESKEFSDTPLNPDELDYQKDPAGYQARKRADLLAEVGLTVDSPPPAAAPATAVPDEAAPAEAAPAEPAATPADALPIATPMH